MGLFDERVAYKPFEYPDYYTEGWLKQAQAFWLHTEIPMPVSYTHLTLPTNREV